MELIEIELSRDTHPVDVVEQIAQNNNWIFQRNNDNQISIIISGAWSEYHLSFYWIDDFEALHLSCSFDLNVPKARSVEIAQLLALINEKLVFGHFDLWEQENTVLFRESLLLSGGAEPTSRQVEVLVSTAFDACENHFQAFQFVIWSTIPAKDAMKNLMFETRGCA